MTSLLPRCPFEGDSYRTRMVASDRADLPFPTHHQRFTVAAFTFLDSGSQRALGGPVRKAVTLAPARSPSKRQKLVSNLPSTL